MTRTGVILLVEDNPDDVELTRRAFAKSRISNEIVVATDGQAALDLLFDDSRTLPEVVLLDLKLPKIDGLEVLRRVRENPRTTRLPVVVLTSSNEEKDVLTSYERGANSFVRKPVDFAEFLDAANSLGLYWLVLNTPAPRR